MATGGSKLSNRKNSLLVSGQLPKSSGPPKRAQPSTSSQHTDAQSGAGVVPPAKISTTSSSEQVLDSVTAKGKCNVQSAESQETLKAINDDISFKSPTISDVKDRARHGVIAPNHNDSGKGASHASPSVSSKAQTHGPRCGNTVPINWARYGP